MYLCFAGENGERYGSGGGGGSGGSILVEGQGLTCEGRISTSGGAAGRTPLQKWYTTKYRHILRSGKYCTRKYRTIKYCTSKYRTAKHLLLKHGVLYYTSKDTAHVKRRSV